MEPYYRFRWNRWWRSARRGWRKLVWLTRRYVFKRTTRLARVQRFMLATLAVMVLGLIGLLAQFRQLPEFYQVAGPRAGGTFVEGAVGSITRLNPLFPEEPSAEVATKLIFNGLTRYNGQGQLEGDLAESWQSNDNGSQYTVRLRDNIYWHDGIKFSAKDVVFTIKAIQNPDTRSPLAGNWSDIEVGAPDDRTVVFKLPADYSPFPNSLTVPIVPEHILGSITPAQLRLADFNQRPVGTGPFEFDEFIASQDLLRLRANTRYVHGAPQLNRFIIHTYPDKAALLKAFADRQVTAASGFGAYEAADFANARQTKLYSWPTTNQTFAFLNNEQPITADLRVRRALVQASQFSKAAAELDFNFTAADGPLLPEQPGYRPDYAQFSYDPEQAKAQFEAAGWVVGEGGIRGKGGQPLQLNLVTQDSDIYPTLAKVLQEQWRSVGVDLKVQLVEDEELRASYLRPRKYDVLLYGIALGADPDIFSYWHSSQEKDPGLNLSRYRSKAADADLEAGRSRTDLRLRAAKYERFMKTWRDDSPAIAAYRPDFLYAVHGRVGGLKVERLVSPIDRFYNVEDWTVNTEADLLRLR